MLDSGSSYYESALKKAAIITFNHTQDFKQSFLYYDKYFQISKVESEKLWAANGAIRSAFKNNDKNGVQNYGEKILSMNSADQEDKALASYFTGKMLYNEKQLDQALTCFQKIGNDINPVSYTHLKKEIIRPKSPDVLPKRSIKTNYSKKVVSNKNKNRK